MGVEDVDRTIALVSGSAPGRTVVLVEHNMHVVGSLADRVTVLQSGSVLAEGPYDEVRRDERVITPTSARASGGRTMGEHEAPARGARPVAWYGEAQALREVDLTVGPARWSRSSAATAPARPRCCAA